MKGKIDFRINMRSPVLEIPSEDMAKAVLLIWCRDQLKMPQSMLEAISVEGVEVTDGFQ